MQRYASPVRRRTMLKQIDALPRAQRHSPALHRNRELSGRQGRSNMRGHVIGPFHGVPVQPVILGRKAAEKHIQIVDHIRVGILLNQQRCRCVLHEDRQQSRAHFLLGKPSGNLTGEFVEPFAARRDLQRVRPLPQRRATCSARSRATRCAFRRSTQP